MNPSPLPAVGLRFRALILFFGCLCVVRPSNAANQTVTSLADSGPGSLRDAIDLVGIGETITFAVTGTIQLTSGELLITDNVTITGPGAATLAIARSSAAGTPSFRIFHIVSSVGHPVSVTISGLAIRNGSGGDGGGIFIAGTSGLAGAPKQAVLLLNDCEIRDNRASGFGGGLSIEYGALAMRNCAVIGNRSYMGGGLDTHISDTILENCTIAGNEADAGAGIEFIGDTLRVTGCTIADNDALTSSSYASCIQCKGTSSAVLTLENTILQAEGPSPALVVIASSPSLPGPQIISNGFNLCSDSGINLNGPGDLRSANARLNPLGPQDNGGTTPTIALLGDSPALDRGKSFGLTTDQRGQMRPRDFAFVANANGGDGSDIGAMESTDVGQAGRDLTVNTTADHDDGIAGAVDCTLREALTALGSSPGVGTVTFAPSVLGTITLDSQLGSLQVIRPLSIAGPGARKLAISGGDGARIFSFTTASAGSALSSLTLRNARGFAATADGGGLFNEGSLLVVDCAFTSNLALALTGSQPGQAGGTARGGAIFNRGTLTVRRCTFAGNTARGGNGANNTAQFGSGGSGGAGRGGAIFNDTGATLDVNNCSFFNNTGTGGNGGNDLNFGGGNGGAGYGGVSNLGTMTLIACTLSGNTATGGAGGLGNSFINNGAPGAAGGGLNAGAGGSAVGNTICAGNGGGSGPDVSGTFSSLGWNFIGNINGSSGFTAASELTGTSAAPLDAKLSALINHGGPTDTFLLLADSPAHDKGSRFGLETDQRNLPRVHDVPATPNSSGGDGADIGAVEMQAAYGGPLKLLSITRVGPTIRVVLQGPPSVNCQFQQTPTLLSPFANLGATQVTDSIGQTEFIDFDPLPLQRFYRGIQSP